MPYKAICAMCCVVAVYGIYMISNPNTNGMAFGTVTALLGLLAGLKMREMQDGGRNRI